jgi:hypothetical protein
VSDAENAQTTKANNDVNMKTKPFVVSDESINSYGFWLKTDGAELESFKNNPIGLWMHMRAWKGTKDEVLPICKWEDLTIEKGKIIATPDFDENDDFALQIASKVEGGYLRMASVGITVLATSAEKELLKPGQTRETVTKWRLREISVVDIGANSNALALAFYDEDGNLLELSEDSTDCPVNLLTTDTTLNLNVTSMKKTIALLKLAEGATDEQLAEKVQELLNQNANLTAEKTAAEVRLKAMEQKEADAKKKEAGTLLAAAIADGRLNADAKPAWEKLFETDHETAKNTLLSIPVRRSAKEQLGDGGENNTELAAFEKLSWDELDRTNKLSEVKQKHPELFEKKFTEKFGKAPQKK